MGYEIKHTMKSCCFYSQRLKLTEPYKLMRSQNNATEVIYELEQVGAYMKRSSITSVFVLLRNAQWTEIQLH